MNKKAMKVIICVLGLIVVLIAYYSIKTPKIYAAVTEDGKYNYTIKDGSVTITKYNKNEESNVIIPRTIESYPVETIEERAFFGCNSIVRVQISENVKCIKDDVFDFCTNLEEINADNDNEMYSSLDGVLYNKEQTKLIRYPEGKKDEYFEIPESVTVIGRQAFLLSIAQEIELPDNLVEIEDGAFGLCELIQEIVIPEQVTTIGQETFFGCKMLSSVNIPEGITTIENDTFANCESLTEIHIPNSVTKIEDRAFQGCSFRSLVIPANVIYVGEDVLAPVIVVYMDSDEEEVEFAEKGTGRKVIGKSPDTTIILANINPDNLGITCTSEEINEGVTKNVFVRYTNDVADSLLQRNDEGINYGFLKLTNLFIDETDIKTWYEGEHFNLEELYVYAIFDEVEYILDDGWSVITPIDMLCDEILAGFVLPELCTITPDTFLATGKQKVTIGYTEGKHTIDINLIVDVSEDEIEDVEIEGIYQTEYIEGDSFNIEGMTVYAIFKSGKRVQVSKAKDELDGGGYNIVDENDRNVVKNGLVLGNDELGIAGNVGKYYFDFKNKIKVTIKPIEVVDIEIEGVYQTEYTEGENFNPEGMTVYAIYNNEGRGKLSFTRPDLETGYSSLIIIDDQNRNVMYEGLHEGNQKLIVRYELLQTGKTFIKTIDVIVNKKENPDIEIDPGEYEINDDLYIENIDLNTTIDEFKSILKTNGDINIYRDDEKIENEDIKLATGMVVEITLGEKQVEYEIVIVGDLTGNGEMGNADLLKMARYKAGLDSSLEGAYLRAADLNNDGNAAGDVDLLKMARTLVGLE